MTEFGLAAFALPVVIAVVRTTRCPNCPELSRDASRATEFSERRRSNQRASVTSTAWSSLPTCVGRPRRRARTKRPGATRSERASAPRRSLLWTLASRARLAYLSPELDRVGSAASDPDRMWLSSAVERRNRLRAPRIAERRHRRGDCVSHRLPSVTGPFSLACGTTLGR